MNSNLPSNHSRNGFRFGFLVCGIAWGLLVGALLAYYPEISGGAFEFPSQELYTYCALCLAISPIVGLVVGIFIDSTVKDIESRNTILKNSWLLFAICVVTFMFFGPALVPAY